MATPYLTLDVASFARDIFNMPLMQGVLRNLDTVLESRGSGTGLRIYDELERDAMVFAVIQKRKMAVIAKPWKVQAASTSLRDRKAAEFVTEQLDRMPFDRLCLDLLDALLKGFSVVEIIWKMQGDYLLPDLMLQRSAVRFAFDSDRALRLRTSESLMQGIPVPERKFIVHSQGGKDGTPYGLGLGSKLYWPVFFKKQAIGFWLGFADRFGSPAVVGKYKIGTPPEGVSKIQKQLEAIAQQTVTTIEETAFIELLEPKSNTLTYEPLMHWCDAQISTAVLGETMSTTASKTGLGGGSQANVHNSVRKELCQADADLLSDTLNATLVRWIVELNLPNANPPRVYRDFSEPEDLKARAQRDQIIATMFGRKPTLKYIQETYGGEWEEAAPVDPAVAAPVADNGVAAATAMLTAQPPFAKGGQGGFDDLDALVDTALADWQQPMASLTATLQAAMDESVTRGESAEQFLASLPALLGKLDADSLTSQLTRAAFTARLAGEAGIEPQDGRS